MQPTAELLKQVQEFHSQGYRVIAASSSWSDSKGLLASLGGSDIHGQDQAIALDALCTKVEAGLRSGVPFFDRPTVVVVADPSLIADLRLETRWETVTAAAQRAPNPVVFLESRRFESVLGRRPDGPKA